MSVVMNMPMPKTCGECRISYLDHYFSENPPLQCGFIEYRTNGIDGSKRHPDCPIVCECEPLTDTEQRRKRAAERRQLAEWLKELKGYRSIKERVAFAKRNIRSENSDYLTGYISALSAVEGMIAEVENAESGDKECR